MSNDTQPVTTKQVTTINMRAWMGPAVNGRNFAHASYYLIGLRKLVCDLIHFFVPSGVQVGSPL